MVNEIDTRTEAKRQRVALKLGRLIEITRILDRNAEDAEFQMQSSDHELFYVFDTNILQMFLEPFRNPQYAEVFHSGTWGNNYEKYQTVNQQACLLTSEYLLSGKLPGQKNTRWYMSRYHFQELTGQLNFVEKQGQTFIDQLAQDSSFQARAGLSLIELRETLDLDAVRDRNRLFDLARKQGDTISDLARLSPAAFAESVAAIKTREICRILAQDRVWEPIDQLSRYRSREIVGRLMPIEQVFRPSHDDNGEIDEEAARWERYLNDALKDRIKGTRSPDALKNDCLTLAHLSWAMRRKAKSNQKIVLVTGDRGLYDAYRRRYIEEPDGLPFLLRPVTQYTPMFNTKDADSSVHEREKAFQQIRETVEVATAALNMGLLGVGGGKRESISRARDYFVLETERSLERVGQTLSGFFRSFNDPVWLDEQEDRLGELIDPLQKVEQLLLGSFPSLIEPRLGAEKEEFITLTALIDGKAQAAALSTRLALAKEKAFFVSLPQMPQTLADLISKIRQRPENRTVRALLAHRFIFTTPDGRELTFDQVIDELEVWANQAIPDAPAEALSTPESLFVFAALLAFDLEQWTDAAAMAGHAANASQYSTARNGKTKTRAQRQQTQDHLEYLYLKAVSLRFKLSAVEPNPSLPSSDMWSKWRRDAEDALERCIAFHDAHRQFVHLTRAYSERASARLSFCEWYAFGHLGEVRGYEDSETELLPVLSGALDDLSKACEYSVKAEETLSDVPNEKHRLETLLESIKPQFQLNTLAARLMIDVLRTKQMVKVESYTEVCDALPDVPLEALDLVGLPLARAYVAATSGDRERLRDIDTRTLTLALDRRIIEGLKAHKLG